MNADQKADIPLTALLTPGTRYLRRWLDARGLRLTLLELEQERRRRTEGRDDD